MSKLKIGLALGGGGVRGIAHLGVLKALEENQISIDYLAGCSSGSFVGGLYASGVPIDTMIHWAKNFKWRRFISTNLFTHSLLSKRKLERYLYKLIGNANIKNLNKPFLSQATNILTGEAVTFYNQDIDLAKVIQASITFPGLFEPYQIGDAHYIDGGVSNNVPIQQLRDIGATCVIAVNITPRSTTEIIPKSIKKTLERSLDLLISRLTDQYIKAADIVLLPNVNNISIFDLKHVDTLIESGYFSVLEQLPKIKEFLEIN